MRFKIQPPPMQTFQALITDLQNYGAGHGCVILKWRWNGMKSKKGV